MPWRPLPPRFTPIASETMQLSALQANTAFGVNRCGPAARFGRHHAPAIRVTDRAVARRPIDVRWTTVCGAEPRGPPSNEPSTDTVILDIPYVKIRFFEGGLPGRKTVAQTMTNELIYLLGEGNFSFATPGAEGRLSVTHGALTPFGDWCRERPRTSIAASSIPWPARVR